MVSLILNVSTSATDDDDEIYSAKLQLECEDLIGVLDGTRQQVLNIKSKKFDGNYGCPTKSKERIVLPSSVSRLVLQPKEEINNVKYQSSTDTMSTPTPAHITRRDIVLIKDFSLNLNVATATALATAEDNNKLKAKIKLEGDSIRN